MTDSDTTARSEDQIDHDVRGAIDAWQVAMDTSYALGADIGYRTGYSAAELDMTEQWHRMWVWFRDHRDDATHAAIVERRRVTHEQCVRRCLDQDDGRICASCIHAEAWERNGRRPFAGNQLNAGVVPRAWNDVTLPPCEVAA